jgi:large subunit ribosomal protein L6
MSRIGNKPIPIPSNAKVTIDGQVVKAEGPHGTLTQEVKSQIGLSISDGQLIVSNTAGHKDDKKFQGLYRSLLNNIVTGVSEGFTRKLEMYGVGYKASVVGNNIVLDIGYSTSKKLVIPDGIKTSVTAISGKTSAEASTIITLWGIKKDQLGQFAADIRALRPPEPYKGKGIRYQGEVVRRKAGKAGAVGKGG